MLKPPGKPGLAIHFFTQTNLKKDPGATQLAMGWPVMEVLGLEDGGPPGPVGAAQDGHAAAGRRVVHHHLGQKKKSESVARAMFGAARNQRLPFA